MIAGEESRERRERGGRRELEMEGKWKRKWEWRGERRESRGSGERREAEERREVGKYPVIYLFIRGGIRPVQLIMASKSFTSLQNTSFSCRWDQKRVLRNMQNLIHSLRLRRGPDSSFIRPRLILFIQRYQWLPPHARFEGRFISLVGSWGGPGGILAGDWPTPWHQLTTAADGPDISSPW